MTKKYLVFSENSEMMTKTFSSLSGAENYIEKQKKIFTSWNFDIFEYLENTKQGSFLR